MKKSLLFIIITLIGIIYNSSAQQPSDKLKQIFLDAEYFYLYDDFEEALYNYNTLYKRGYSDNGNINYRIGQCYLNLSGEKNKAISYLLKATNLADAKYTEGSFKETKAPIDAYFYLGIAYRIDNQLNKADSAFAKFKELVGRKNLVANKIADYEILALSNAREAMKRPLTVKITNMGRPISTGTKDFYPAISGDESILVYNSAQKFYDAVFFAKKVNSKWTAPINITPEVQSDGNQYVSSVSYDGKELFLRMEDNFEAEIMVSRYENGRWTKSKPLNKNINTKFFEGNASMSKDGKVLYFSSNKSGGIGSLDLYKSNRLPNGDWGIAENLGDIINTDLNEDVPFISEDGKKLYFISQGHNTIGGYDIFYSILDVNGKWTKPVNMGYPVNTTDDNTSFAPLYNGDIGYASMYYVDGLGREDLYRVTISESKEIAALDPAKDSAVQQVAEVVQPLIKNEPVDTSKKEPELAIVKPDKKRELPIDVENAMSKAVETEKEKEMYILRSLFFDFNSSELTETSKKELEYMSIVLRNYTELKIQFVGNTDAIGGDKYNTILSERRALAARKFLITKGIVASRVLIKGQGKKEFVAVNKNADGTDNPDGRKYNRRVDIHFLSSKPENVIVEPAKVPDNLKIK